MLFFLNARNLQLDLLKALCAHHANCDFIHLIACIHGWMIKTRMGAV